MIYADRLQRNIVRVCLAALLAAGVLFASVPAIAADGGGGDYIVKYKADAAYLMADGSAPFDVVSRSEALRLDRAGLLEWYEPDGVGFLLEEPADHTDSDYYESYQWNLDLIGAEEAFQRGCLGQGVRIGVVDSGISPHPALSERLLPGHNYVENARDETEYDGAGRCLGVRSWDYTVPARDCVEIAPPDEDTIYGQFVFETATMTPLANARKSLSK